MPKPEDQGQAEKAWELTPDKAAVIGPTVVCTGELTGDEDIVIKGTLRGKIHLPKHSLFIEAGARIEADIAAANVMLRGNLTGNIRATGKVLVSSAARMNGDIAAARVSIQDGAQFKGSIKIMKGDA